MMVGVWSSGGNLATARQALAGAGTQTAGLSFGGVTTIAVTTTEEYNGTSWSSGGNLATAKYYLAGAGTQTAGLSFGGVTTIVVATTEEYDGTSWASGGNLATARRELAGAGTQTAGLSFGGYDSGWSILTSCEEYDGTSWSSGGNLATARASLAGAGTQTAGLSFGGYAGSLSAVTEEYDGTSWAAGGNLATARYYLGGAGTQTAGLSFGGVTGTHSAITEEYAYIEIFPPTVTTQASSSITTLGFTGNGNITDTGGVPVTRRGFCYVAGTSGDPTTSNSVSYDDGSFSTGAYTKAVTGLASQTSYRVRAYAIHLGGTGYGSTIDVLTLSKIRRPSLTGGMCE